MGLYGNLALLEKGFKSCKIGTVYTQTKKQINRLTVFLFAK